MTNEEFLRIATATFQMATVNVNGELFVRLEGVLHIIQSNLHEEDKGVWKIVRNAHGIHLARKEEST